MNIADLTRPEQFDTPERAVDRVNGLCLDRW